MKSMISAINARLQMERNMDKDNLGDRTKYIGASEVTSCQLKVFFEKTQPEKVLHDDETLMIFQRGHLSEDILLKTLISIDGLKFTSQQEVKTVNGEIKAHIDFTVENDDGSITIIECKTTNLVGLDEPRESWVAQVQVQMALLRQETNNKKINSIIYAVDLSTGKSREWIVKYDKTLATKIINKAKKLYQDIQEQKQPRGTINPLCSFCSFKEECPTLKKGIQTIPKEFSSYIKVINSFKLVEKKVKCMKDEMKHFMKSVGISKGWDEENKYVVAFTRRKQKGVDNKTLHEDNPHLKELYTVERDIETLRIV